MSIKNIELFHKWSKELAKSIVSYTASETKLDELYFTKFDLTMSEVEEKIANTFFGGFHQVYRNTINNIILNAPDKQIPRVEEIALKVCKSNYEDVQFQYSNGVFNQEETVKNAVMELVKNRAQHKAHDAQLESLTKPRQPLKTVNKGKK